MFWKICFCLIVCITYLEPFSSAEYQYLGVRNVNQMEPPSLESVGSLEGQYQHDQEMGSQPGAGRSIQGQGSGQGAGRGRSLGGYPGEQKDCDKNKPNRGWRPAVGYDRPVMRSLTPKKPCNKAGKGRSLNDNADSITSSIKMLERKKEETPLKEVSRVQMSPQEDKPEEKDLKPNIKEKIYTYTETYMATSLATRIITRKRVFMQKRKIVNQKINRPIVVIRRKIIKERQIFERIIPKIIETREIINNPIVKSKVVEGPIYEVPQPDSGSDPNGTGHMRSLDDSTDDCPEVVFDPNSGDTIDGAQAVSSP